MEGQLGFPKHVEDYLKNQITAQLSLCLPAQVCSELLGFPDKNEPGKYGSSR